MHGVGTLVSWLMFLPNTYSPKTFKYCQNGKISPNLVTLVTSAAVDYNMLIPILLALDQGEAV